MITLRMLLIILVLSISYLFIIWLTLTVTSSNKKKKTKYDTVHCVTNNRVIHSRDPICHISASSNRRCDIYSWYLYNSSSAHSKLQQGIWKIWQYTFQSRLLCEIFMQF